MVLPACGPDIGFHLAERLRRSVEEESVVDNGKIIRVTLSLGVAVWDANMESDDLLRSADNALYRAKNAGRNRAVLAPLEQSRPSDGVLDKSVTGAGLGQVSR